MKVPVHFIVRLLSETKDNYYQDFFKSMCAFTYYFM